MGEADFAARLLRAPLVGVTGTNGKSTVVSLLGEMLRRDGRRVFVGGNLGEPLVNALTGDYQVVVAELSSFQLEAAERLRPRVAVLLNVARDHLDRHGSFQAYLHAKLRIFQAQGEEDWALVGADPRLVALTRGLQAKRAILGRRGRAGAWVEGKRAVCDLDGRRLTVDMAKFRLRGEHNLRNALAAIAAAHCLGCSPRAMAEALREFRGLEHRLEPVARVGGVEVINDSKATNPHATAWALRSLSCPVVLIAGGRAKPGGFGSLRPWVRRRVRAAVLLGECREEMARALRGATRVLTVGSLGEAVRQALRLARPGEAVLFSPACASFDMFADYEERGRAFKEEVLRLAGRDR